MKKIRRVLGLFIITGIILAGIGGFNLAQAAEDDTFTITVTVNFIEISLRNTTDTADYETWAIPQMALAASGPMANASGVHVDLGTTNTNVDIKTHVSNDGDAWTLAATPGADIFSLVVSGTTVTTAPDWTPCISVTDTTQIIVTDASPAASNFLYYKFYSPLSVGTGTGQTITVTVEIVAS